MTIRKEDALQYHSAHPPGKLAVVPTKPCIPPLAGYAIFAEAAGW